MCDKHKWVGHSRQNSSIAPERFQPWYMQTDSQLNSEIIKVKMIKSHEPLNLCLEVTEGAIRKMWGRCGKVKITPTAFENKRGHADYFWLFGDFITIDFYRKEPFVTSFFNLACLAEMNPDGWVFQCLLPFWFWAICFMLAQHSMFISSKHSVILSKTDANFFLHVFL